VTAERGEPMAQKTWRDVLPVHPASDLFPMMGDDEINDLAADIEKHGLHERVVLWTDGDAVSLLDGRNRIAALEKLGQTIKLHRARRRPGSDLGQPSLRADDYPVGVVGYVEDPYEYVLSANVHRRHLTPDQKRTIVAAVLKAQPEKSDRQIAKQTGVSHPTVAKERKKAEKAGDVEEVSTRTDTKGRKQPVKKPTVPEPSEDQSPDEQAPRQRHTYAGVRIETVQVGPKTSNQSIVSDDDDDERRVKDALRSDTKEVVKLLKEIRKASGFLSVADVNRLEDALGLIITMPWPDR
jgi:hypothetical protein